MGDQEKDELRDALQGYKAGITPGVKATLAWSQDRVFTGTTPQGYEIEFDADAQWGCKPTEALLLSLAGCMAIDIVSILNKMRVALTAFKVEVAGERNPQPPQFFRSVEMTLHIAGRNLDARRVERAIALSRQTYCSVYNSLRPDLELTVRCVLEEAAGAPEDIH